MELDSRDPNSYPNSQLTGNDMLHRSIRQPVASLKEKDVNRGCLKSRNPLTAKIAKDIRKGRKELNINDIALRTLRHLSALRG